MKGKVWPSEAKAHKDRVTGLSVRQLTDHKTHSHHFYFTESGWYDEERRLLFFSDRGNSTNLYSMDVESGEMQQLTDYPDNNDLEACIHPDERIVYVRVKGQIVELDMTTLEERVVFSCPEGFGIGNMSCSADGRYVLTCIQEDLSHRLDLDLGHGYVGHRELMEAKPVSRIVRIDVDTDEVDVCYEAHCFITHINASGTVPWLITFCHEGPWQLVDHRIWGLDLRNGKAWKIRERLEPAEKVGHEFFFPDGERIGYHGFRLDGTNYFGSIRYDNTEMEEHDFPFDTWHAHADGKDQAVVDGKGQVKTLVMWRRDQTADFGPPRILCELRCSFHSQKVHAHPRFNRTGERILFTSDKNGYANLYMVELPEDIEVLPVMEC
ncbi:oligogalacturonate lyase family protein [Paenibacillus daejeonensis]|uniref:oligogalacturonate lyase family protein n=1 Tax=Paenibacillus daejeonensis TaxID=135193 RepID=UPI00037E78F2|nr:oligogalacturonate lyase family protein [Paenibacillus daejeonensis]